VLHHSGTFGFVQNFHIYNESEPKLKWFFFSACLQF
jgi:hypothetical protein